ncbi:MULTISPECIES: zinc ribbon domain-containing protein [Citrobacter]|uniref:zinc ribbon domain-containing protein n=1 Tax=Citrobacter TaxID=544 RepID=UPI002016FAD5|nr:MULTISPECIES: zinc ribbon domain-containing protein [Citrobacter]
MIVKIIGYIAIAIGIIFAVSALFMDVTVAVGDGYRVNNLGLMSSRQNYMIFGGFVAIAGLIITLVGDKLKAFATSVKCPYCAEPISAEAVKCKHCGSEVTPSSDISIAEKTEAGNRLVGVNVKIIAGAVVLVFAAIIASIIIYRQ